MEKKTLHKHNDVEVLPVTDCRTHINPVDRQRQRDTHTETLSLPRILRSAPRVTFSLDSLSLSLSPLFLFFCIYFKSTLFHFCSHTSFLSLTRTHTQRERNFSFFANQRGTLFSSLADCFPFLLSRVRVSRLFLRSTRFFFCFCFF